jgi:hypothetical protein
MDCLATVFVSSGILSTFSVVLLVLGLPQRSSPTDTRSASEHECHSETTVWFKECSSESFAKHFKGFGNGFTELHTKLDADTLLDFDSHCSQNET